MCGSSFDVPPPAGRGSGQEQFARVLEHSIDGDAPEIREQEFASIAQRDQLASGREFDALGEALRPMLRFGWQLLH